MRSVPVNGVACRGLEYPRQAVPVGRGDWADGRVRGEGDGRGAEGRGGEDDGVEREEGRGRGWEESGKGRGWRWDKRMRGKSNG